MCERVCVQRSLHNEPAVDICVYNLYKYTHAKYRCIESPRDALETINAPNTRSVNWKGFLKGSFAVSDCTLIFRVFITRRVIMNT